MPQDTEGRAEFEQEPLLSPLSDHGDLEDTAVLSEEFERDRTISPLPQDTEDTALSEEFKRDRTISPLPQDTEDTAALFNEFERDRTISPLPQDIEDTAALFKEFERDKTISPLPQDRDVAASFKECEWQKTQPPLLVADASLTGSQKIFESKKENYPPLNQLPFTPLAVWRTQRKKRKRNLYGHT